MRCLLTAGVIAVASVFAAHSTSDADELDAPTIGIAVAALADAKGPIQDTLKLSLPTNDGVVVLRVLPYSPAEKAGIHPLDIVASINGKRMKSVADFSDVAKTFKVGEKCKVDGYTQPPKNAKNRKWRHGTVEIRPVRRRDIYLAAMKVDVDKIKERSFSPTPRRASVGCRKRRQALFLKGGFQTRRSSTPNTVRRG